VAGWVSKCADSIEAYSQKENGLFVFALRLAARKAGLGSMGGHQGNIKKQDPKSLTGEGTIPPTILFLAVNLATRREVRRESSNGSASRRRINFIVW
jgi:hypothetical protein